MTWLEGSHIGRCPGYCEAAGAEAAAREEASALFVFSTIVTVATWFLVRAAYDLVLPSHRHDRHMQRRRAAVITFGGALVAATLAGSIVGALYGRGPGIVTAVVLGCGYVAFVALLRWLLAAWKAGDR